MNNPTQIINFLKYLSLHGVSPKSLKYYKSDLVNFLNWSGDRKVTSVLIQEYITSARLTTPTSTLNRRISTLRSYGTFMGFKKTANSWQTAILSKFENKQKFHGFLNKLFFSRPDWYRKYHSYQLATYIHIAILVLFTSLSGYALYDQVFRNANNPLAFPTALTRPNRFLSFQGRLTSNVGNPITVATNLVFKLYDASTAGTELWSSGTCSITPDQDGIFSTLLGSSCGAEIAATVFSENASVWVGVTVGADAEATPRIQIATVAYALNTETLQGYPAGTGTSTIPYIGSTGILVLANASPTIQSTSGTFAVEGLAMTITTPNTSDGIITINPDGVGTLDLTFEGAAAGASANGFINATNANITSGALYGGTVASAATGYNFIDFQSGVSPTSKFSVSATGAITTASGLTIGTTSLSETTSPTDSGGYLIGVNDEFANSSSTNVQAVLNDLDASITTGSTPKWNALTVPDGNLSLAHAGYTTAFTFDSVTTADAFALSSSSLSTGTILDLSSTSTAGGASGLSKVLDITRSGTNANASHTAYGLYSAVTNTGTTSTNVGGYFSASGATNNYGLIVANGNVGIGTTGPLSKLDFGTSAANNKIVVGTYMGGASGLWTGIGMDSATAGMRLAGDSNASGPLVDIGYYSSDVNHDWTSKVYIQPSGNVGIGTTSPGEKLDVVGNSKVSLNMVVGTTVPANIATADNYHHIINGQSTFLNEQFSGYEGFSILANGYYTTDWKSFDTAKPTWNLKMGYGTNTDALRILRAPATAGTLAFAELFRITNSGNVGIGTTAPGEKLSVKDGDVSIFGASRDSNLFLGDSGSGGAYGYIKWDYTNDYLQLGHSTGGVKMTLQEGGNVGIGTTGPTGKLHIVGDDGSYATVRLDVSSNTNWHAPMFEGRRSRGTAASKLYPSGSDNLFRLIGQGWSQSSASFENAGYINIDAESTWTAGSYPSMVTFFTGTNGSPTEKVRITSAGNVGIGTTNPQQLLTLSASDNPVLRFDRSGAGAYDWEIYSISGGTLRFRGGADGTGASLSDLVTFSSTGNVGIGTTSPGAKLDVQGNISNMVSAVSTYNAGGNSIGYYTSMLTSNTGGNYGVYSSVANAGGAAFSFYGNAGTLYNAGNVGIGTTSPLAKLHVVGSCVTGDTLLPIRRRRRRKSDGLELEEDDDPLWDYLLCRIDEILPGDEVLSLNEFTGAMEYSRINALKDMDIREVYELTTKSGKVIRTTANHPYLTLSEDSPIDNEEKINI